jgi:hypothetical protein
VDHGAGEGTGEVLFFPRAQYEWGQVHNFIISVYQSSVQRHL